MKKTRGLLSIIFILSITSSLMADIINVPGDISTIQAGINIADNGDTVLVQPGTYAENINFNGKNITVSSLFLTTEDTTYISQTVIDGNQNGYSVVKFNSGEDWTAILTGFTIMNGRTASGGGIYCFNSDPMLENLIISENNATHHGGGILCENSSSHLTNVKISGNTARDKGGGIFCSWNSNPSLINVKICRNKADQYGGGIYCDNSTLSFNTNNRCDIFLNFAGQGNDLYCEDCPTINVIADTFTVFEPDDYFAYPIDNFTFDILHNKIEQVNRDLYVSPDGSNDNSGIFPDDPLRTVSYTLAKVIADSMNPHIIHLANGYYSPSKTGEIFPLNCKSYVTLQGDDEEIVILNGEESSNILFCYKDSSFSVRNITIMNGWTRNFGGGIFCRYSNPSFENIRVTGNRGHRGGGVYCSNSNMYLKNVIISGNITSWNGGGILCANSTLNLKNVTMHGNSANVSGGGTYFYKSDPNLTNVTISKNTAGLNGGGIWCLKSNPSFANVTIRENTAHNAGGGICCGSNSNLSFNTLNRCNIFLNFASEGNDIFTYDCPTINVIVDTFTVLEPNEHFADPIDNFTFAILHSKIESVNKDLYVSSDGSNDNSGLVPDDPLLTISYALAKVVADSTNPHTIHLANGTYSPSLTGEIFPLYCRSYVSLQGEDGSSTILNGEELSNILFCHQDSCFSIENMTIYNGNAKSGGGIFCRYSNMSFENVIIRGNSANDTGGGIYFQYSNSDLTNVIISENMASNAGGGIVCVGSSLSLNNITMSENTSSDYGGGISCWNNSNLILLNCILWNDSPQEFYSGQSELPSPNTLTVSYSDIQGDSTAMVINNNDSVKWLDGNIDEDPLFADILYHLSSGSPCIDAGIQDTFSLNLPPWDLDGNRRIWDGDEDETAIIDMGAYEYNAKSFK